MILIQNNEVRESLSISRVSLHDIRPWEHLFKLFYKLSLKNTFTFAHAMHLKKIYNMFYDREKKKNQSRSSLPI